MSAPSQGDQRVDDVLGVVVLFHPDDAALENVERIHAQVGELLVVDNTPAPHPSAAPERLAYLPGLRWHSEGVNLGVAAALNVGVRRLLEGGRGWLATFDQDTRPQTGFVQGLLAAAGDHPEPSSIGMVAPRLVAKGKPGTREVHWVITSGSIVRTEALRRIGGYREELFIDFVDFDCCIRLRIAGFVLLETSAVSMEHRIGDPTSVAVMGVQLTSSHHSPVRRYFKYRNRMVMLRDYFTREPLWCLRQALSSLVEPAKILLLEEQRAEKLGMMAKGVRDGILGRMGPGHPQARPGSQRGR